MEKIFILFLALAAFCAQAQTIRRVNNNPGVTGVNVYTTAQAAHDAASANDILMIEPSVTRYGNLILTKPLKIYGSGYSKAINTELAADVRSSILDVIEFDTGSDGSELYGVTFFDRINPIYIYGVSNIKIIKNFWGVINIHTRDKSNTIHNGVSNIVIKSNYLEGSWPASNPISANPTGTNVISNVLIENNIFYNYGYYTNGIAANQSTGVNAWIVRNNTFTSSLNILLSNSIFENNILLGGNPSFNNVTYSYNVSSSDSFSGGTGNQNNFSVSAQFIGSGSGISEDEVYQLKAGSPLKTAGSSGTEVGAYGGTTPYVVSGIPPIPSIVNFNNTATGSNSTPVQVTISVKSNN